MISEICTQRFVGVVLLLYPNVDGRRELNARLAAINYKYRRNQSDIHNVRLVNSVLITAAAKNSLTVSRQLEGNIMRLCLPVLYWRRVCFIKYSLDFAENFVSWHHSCPAVIDENE